MKLIPQSEIDKAAVNYEWSKSFANSYIDFKAGVEFATSKFESILKAYTEYLGIETDGSLITTFIEIRDEENRG